MKKFIITAFAIMALAACTTEEPSVQIQAPVAKSELKSLNNFASCSSNEILIGTLASINQTDIRGIHCNSGRGFCSFTGKGFVFTCVPDSTSPFDVMRPSYDPATDKITAVAVGSANSIKLYFSADVLNSNNTDWDYFDVGTTQVSENVYTVEGLYPKHIEGNYLIYEVGLVKK